MLRIYNSAYQQTSARENASEELINKTSAEMRNLALQAIESYTGEGVDATFDISLYEDDAKLYVVSMLYDIASLIAPTQYNDDELKMFQTSVKILSDNAINNYQIWLGEGFTKPDAREKSTASLTDQIPDGVTKALTELGAMDLSGLIVGGMFYNMAGLLLPLVFVITTANALLAGQVDSGSMAYVLSTPTKRRTVTFTQMIFLISSLFAMFLIQTICGEIALACVDGFGIDYKEILLLNIGAFFTCFAFAGVCFMCSAIFNRSKHSISVGGGFTIFSLVCTILGLFGSNMMPSIMRISAMNAFNYLSIITFFDVSSILSGAMGLIWKMAILAIIGITGFVVGIFKFEKKDLPL